jgi:hypothetical protein
MKISKRSKESVPGLGFQPFRAAKSSEKTVEANESPPIKTTSYGGGTLAGFLPEASSWRDRREGRNDLDRGRETEAERKKVKARLEWNSELLLD